MIDWSQAPEGAEYFNNSTDMFYKLDNGTLYFYHVNEWLESEEYNTVNHEFTPRPQQWPTDEQRIDVIGTNGPSGEHYVDNTEQVYPKSHGFVERAIAAVEQRVTVNKYDRTIIGKYGTGSCTVDVYRVLNAFGPLSPEIDHSVKKLLAAGTRGAKSERQDLLEAIQSIEARLQYLEARDGDKQ